MKCDKQEFTAWINWAALRGDKAVNKVDRTFTGQKDFSSSLFSLALSFYFHPIHRSSSRSLNICPKSRDTHTHSLALQWRGCGWKHRAINSTLCAVKVALGHVVQLQGRIVADSTTRGQMLSRTVTGVKETLNPGSWRPVVWEANCRMSYTSQWSDVLCGHGSTSIERNTINKIEVIIFLFPLLFWLYYIFLLLQTVDDKKHERAAESITFYGWSDNPPCAVKFTALWRMKTNIHNTPAGAVDNKDMLPYSCKDIVYNQCASYALNSDLVANLVDSTSMYWWCARSATLKTWERLSSCLVSASVHDTVGCVRALSINTKTGSDHIVWLGPFID